MVVHKVGMHGEYVGDLEHLGIIGTTHGFPGTAHTTLPPLTEERGQRGQKQSLGKVQGNTAEQVP